jgi:WD40 repeat protein
MAHAPAVSSCHYLRGSAADRLGDAAAPAKAVFRAGAVVKAWALLLGALAAGATAPPPEAAVPPPGPKERQQRHAEAVQLRTDRQGDPLPPGARLRLGTARLRPGGWVSSVLFLPGDGPLLSCSHNFGGPTRILLWNRSTGKLLRELPPQAGYAAIALSPDGKVLASGGSAKVIRLCDIASGKEVGRLDGARRRVTLLAFTADGKVLASAEEDGIVRLWDVAATRQVQALTGHGQPLMALAFSADGKTLASAGRDETLRLWDVATGRQVRQLTGEGANFWSVAFSPDGRLLAAGTAPEGAVFLWKAAGGELVRRLRTPGQAAAALAFSPDGKLLATGAAGRGAPNCPVCLWEVASGKEVRRFRGHTLIVRALAFAAGDSGGAAPPLLASGGQDGTVRLWDLATGKEACAGAGHTGAVSSVAFSPDGKTVCSASGDATARLWDAGTGREVAILRGHQDAVLRARFAPDGGRGGVTPPLLATGSLGGEVRLWEAATGKALWRGDAGTVFDLDFAPDGKTLAIVGNSTAVRLWDVASARERLRLEGGLGSGLSAVALSPDGRLLAAAGGWRCAVWEAASGRRQEAVTAAINAAPPEQSAGYDYPYIAISPDGRTLALSRPDGGVRLWELATGGERLRLGGHEKEITALAFAADGRTLVTSSLDDTVRLWDTGTGRELRRLPGHRGPTYSLALSPDGRTLASGGADTTVLLWDVAELTQRAPARTTLAAGEWEALWADLAAADAARAYRAVGRLGASGAQAVDRLKRELTPVREAEPKRVGPLLADLDSARFAVRERASRQLLQLGEPAVPALRRALSRPGTSLEFRRRIEEVLDRVAALSVGRLRLLRAVEALERNGTGEARQLLEALSRGLPEARLTREARSALGRLTKRAAGAP